MYIYTYIYIYKDACTYTYIYIHVTYACIHTYHILYSTSVLQPPGHSKDRSNDHTSGRARAGDAP